MGIKEEFGAGSRLLAIKNSSQLRILRTFYRQILANLFRIIYLISISVTL